ncbi:tachylectin-related carbohydrate-binding protein [Amycolatopsis sp., V23-08]|uniref:Tachylectin-related carbohydrate-binding protein n=1 Tax=Amycolatopsis heterodermiae TaxID=3110235 RepID=A0ABU5REH1_9PSEU|nr:tachylectin-related carbohydrate-binding protein [Amycolatopsis sp., V23-08]MEA5364681.1 tachylectin-related carbohydrate-binding protein [Amycolatopsis sp., V23-08]
MTNSRTAVVFTAAVACCLLTAVPAEALSGGTAVPAGTHPFLARITTPTKACSGSLIDPSWLLTSATCLTATESGASSEAAGITVGDVVTTVAKVVRNPGRDVVLAKLAAPATGVAPVTVATTAPQAGETLQVAGFGRTTTDWVPARPRVAPFTVSGVTGASVAVSSAGGVDTCKGDAGGPAFRLNGGTAELVALSSASWQHGCLDVTETRQGSVETRVDDLGDWIRRHVVPTPVSCSPAAVWTARADGSLWRYVHFAAADGGLTWTTPDAPVGSGWTGRVLAGKDGVIWDIHRSNGSADPYPGGALKRWGYSPTAGWSGGGQVGSGWERYLTPEYAHRITVDQRNRIFMIDDQNRLKVYLWDDATGWWVNGVGDVLDTGWNRFDSITAAGDGVLYARKPTGELFRFQYDFATSAWAQKDKPVGVGWQMFSEIFSPGADILYGRGSTGTIPWTGQPGPVLRWYRYSDNTDSWAPSGPDHMGVTVGSGWDTEIHVTAAPDSCKLTD